MTVVFEWQVQRQVRSLMGEVRWMRVGGYATQAQAEAAARVEATRARARRERFISFRIVRCQRPDA